MLDIGSNDVINQTKDKINNEKLTEDIINLGKFYINLGMKEVIISSILPRNNIVLTHLILQVNDILREHCILNGLGFISKMIIYFKNTFME